MLVPGDLILGEISGRQDALRSEYVQWTNAFASIYAAGIPIYPIRGNHETWGDDNQRHGLSFGLWRIGSK